MSHSRPHHIRALDTVTPVAITSSTDATPIVVTATSHGLVTGDTVAIQGHTTNVAANGIFQVTKITDNTFSLQNWHTHASVAGSGSGAGASGVLYKNPKVIYTGDHDSMIIDIGTSGSTSMTVKFAGTEMDMFRGEGNPGGTLAIGNRWAFLDFAERDGGGAITDGDTGLSWAGTADTKSVELNVDSVRHIVVLVTAWTAGAITADVSLYDAG